MVFRADGRKTWNSGKSGKPLGSWQKVIGDQVARKIEAAANKPRTGLISIARFLRKVFSLSAQAHWSAGGSQPGTLDERKPRPLTQGKLHRASGVAQVTISRL